MKRIVVLSVVAGTLAAGPALASDFSYKYGNIAYLSESSGGNSGSGFDLDGSAALGPNVNVVASYANVSINSSTINPGTLGVGYHRDMGNWDALAQVRYLSISISGGISGTGYIVSLGGRVALNDNFELQGLIGTDSMTFFGVAGTGTRIEVNGVYHINDQWGASLNYRDESNPQYKFSDVTVGARYNF